MTACKIAVSKIPMIYRILHYKNEWSLCALRSSIETTTFASNIFPLYVIWIAPIINIPVIMTNAYYLQNIINVRLVSLNNKIGNQLIFTVDNSRLHSIRADPEVLENSDMRFPLTWIPFSMYGIIYQGYFPAGIILHEIRKKWDNIPPEIISNWI